MEKILHSLKTIELAKSGAEYLKACDVPDSRAEADLLLAAILKVARATLYAEPDWEVSSQDRNDYLQLLTRRGNRQPLAYLLKTREFMGLEFYVDERVLIPRPETELLVEKTLEMGKTIAEKKNQTEEKNKVKKENKPEEQVRILDLCTGSGAIAVSLAFYFPSASVTAGDISWEALAVARQNALRLQAEVDFRQGDLFTPFPGETFDLLVSNPPYVSAEEYSRCSPEVQKEPSLALLGGQDGLEFYRKIALEGGNYLNPGGSILLEIGCSQGAVVARLFQEQGYKTAIFTDYAGLDRIVLAEKE